MAHKIRYIMVGGFLGAGKTTTLGRLAAHYRDRGLNVGIVTNDQAEQLVDTGLLRGQGFAVGEVAGACFCCQFDNLVETARCLDAGAGVGPGVRVSQGDADGPIRPDVILAEPVGSCTDLVATVIQPLRQMFDAEFEVAPYPVILKPTHAAKILRGGGTGFSEKAEYILRKQLEEADAVLINRIDELPPGEADELERLVHEQFPGVPVLRISAKTGEGFDALTELLDRPAPEGGGAFGGRVLEIDYDVYAEGEAELGWFNGTAHVSAPAAFDLDGLLRDVIGRLKAAFAEEEYETAHLKAIGTRDGYFGVANLVSGDSEPTLSLPSGQSVDGAEVTVNARVGGDPDRLDDLVRAAVDAACGSLGAEADFRNVRSFRPGRPEPTHRLAAV